MKLALSHRKQQLEALPYGALRPTPSCCCPQMEHQAFSSASKRQKRKQSCSFNNKGGLYNWLINIAFIPRKKYMIIEEKEAL